MCQRFEIMNERKELQMCRPISNCRCVDRSVEMQHRNVWRLCDRTYERSAISQL